MAKFIRQRIDIILDALVLVFSGNMYSVIALVLAGIMAITYPLLFPIAVGAKRISLFAFRGNLLDIGILTSISILFGVTMTMQLYKFRKISKEYKNTGTNLISIVSGFIASKACCILPLILLAIGATTGIAFFVQHTTEIRLIGLFILGLTLYWTSMDISGVSKCGNCNSQLDTTG